MLSFALPRNAALANSVIIFVGVIAILYVGENVILPFVIAGILTVILLPGVLFLVKFRVPRSIAIAIAVVTALGVVLATGSLVGRTAMQIISDLPQYEQQLRDKAETLKSATTSSAYSNAARVFQHLQQEIAAAPNADTIGTVPQKSVIADGDSFNGLTWVKSILSTVAHPFLQLATIFVLLTFMLFYHEELRDRLILLGGAYDLRRTTMAVNDTAKRLSRLMLGILSINLLVGLVIGTALWMLGVPGALMWGILTALLRFVPFVGTFIASAFPILTALAVGDGWSLALSAAAVIAVSEFAAAQFLEPLVIGRMSGLWPPALIAAALFWVAVWGPVGLIVSTPITICLLALSQHIRAWRPVAVLLGEASVLTPEDAFYGRLIVGDVAGITVLTGNSDADADVFLTKVVVPALARISHDIERGEVERDQLQEIKDTLEESLEILTPVEDRADNSGPTTLVVSSHGVVNYCAALAFAALLRSKGVSNRVVRYAEVVRTAGPPKRGRAPIVIVSLVPHDARLVQSVVRKLKMRFTNATISSVAWLPDDEQKQFKPALEVASELADKAQLQIRRRISPVPAGATLSSLRQQPT